MMRRPPITRRRDQTGGAPERPSFGGGTAFGVMKGVGVLPIVWHALRLLPDDQNRLSNPIAEQRIDGPRKPNKNPVPECDLLL